MGDARGTGWENEQPLHKVRVRKFAIGIYSVTFAEYDKFATATGRNKPDDHGWGREDRPIINVSWLDASAYCEWLSGECNQHYRLPTEAEWEFAARADTEADYGWGNDIGENLANCNGSNSRWSNETTAPVGSFSPNPFGLFDMVGNVWEWTCSKYEKEYAGEEQHYLNQNLAREHRAIRGGSWRDHPHRARVSARIGSRPDYRTSSRGFRLVSRTDAPLSSYPGWMP